MKRLLLLIILILWLITPPFVKADTNFLLNISGNVKLKRDGWSNYISVGFGTRLRSDDLLKIDGKATILCGDLTAKPASGLISTPCSDIGILEYGGARFGALRNVKRDHLRDIPYILYPRNTLIIDNRPLLRWHDTGAGSYTVAIMKGGVAIWKKKVIGTELQYPADETALQPNIDYILWVVDNDSGNTSGKDPEKGLGFQVVTADGLNTIKAQQEQIMTLSSLDNTARRFALGVYYISVEISSGGFFPWGEAWRIFDSLAQKQDYVAIHLILGDVLTRIKLPNEAKTAYKNAMQYAQKLGDFESQAKSHAELWILTRDESHFKKALELYKQLGDDAQVDALKNKTQ